MKTLKDKSLACDKMNEYGLHDDKGNKGTNKLPVNVTHFRVSQRLISSSYLNKVIK